MDKLFQNKWAIRIMSLIFAVSLYLYVNIETDTAKTDSSVIPGASTEVQVLDGVPLDVKIDADQYVVSGVPEEVTVSLEGKTSVLTPIVRQRNFKVFADLRELGEGEHTVNIEYENIPKNLKTYIEPKSIDVEIEKRASREFAIDVDFVNMDKLPIGYELGDVEVNPETVTIVSSENVIDQIAMVKAYIDVKDLKESIRNREVPISVYDIQGNDLNVRVEPGSVAVSLPVERPSKKVPLTIETKGELPEGFEMKEVEADEEIEVFGKKETLNNLDSISTKELDLSKVEKSGEYQVELDFPDDVTANEEETTVEVELERQKVFEAVDIEVKGKDSSAVTFVEPDTSKMKVTAKGSDQAVAGLKKADVKAEIDLKGVPDGEHQAKVNITGPEGITYEPEFKNVKVDVKTD